MRWIILILLLVHCTGCVSAPPDRLSFPPKSFSLDDAKESFDVDRNDKPDFAITIDPNGRADRLLYDDNEDGAPDRIYRISDNRTADLPHVVILLDSVPLASIQKRIKSLDFPWFSQPAKVISSFPSITETCYTELLHAPPLPGMIDTQYDPRIGGYRSDLWQRICGQEEPWERRTHYHATYFQHGLSFLEPRSWYAAELALAKKKIDASADATTYVYFASAASLACKYGQQGIGEVLDGARQLCLQLLYERRGAIRITMMADHGHNLAVSKNVALDELVTKSGFKISSRLQNENDVVISNHGLVTCAAIETKQPTRVCRALVQDSRIDLAICREGDRVIVYSAAGSAAIEARGELLRYVPIDADVLGYGNVIDGFASRDAWLDATADMQYPNAPPRLWDAFTRLYQSPPSVIVVTKDGYCAGKPEYERWIEMRSTHGGLNQVNSATFVTSTHESPAGPIAQRDVLKKLGLTVPPRVLR